METTDHGRRLPIRRRSHAGVPFAVVLVLAGGGVAGGSTGSEKVELGGGVTLIQQHADEQGIDDSLTASLDLYLATGFGRGTLELYVEGNTTPERDGVAALVPEVNGDAGSALDRDGRGRLQVSELKYDVPLPGDRALAAGLLDLSAYLDTTRINNDENLQFLAAPLINNPAIEFPDYTLGVVFRQPSAAGRARIHAALASSNGLADNPEASYSELVDVDARGKGVFAAVETGWTSKRRLYRLGGWLNTRSHVNLGDGSTGKSNAGLWLAASQVVGRSTFNLRAGAADRDVSPGDRFASFAYQLDRGRTVLGVAIAGLHASQRLPGAEDTGQLETYLSIRLADETFLTSAIQQVWNSGFDAAPAADRIAVFSLRLHQAF